MAITLMLLVMQNAKRKKQLDYARERRPHINNTDKGARKAIPRWKQIDAKNQRQLRKQLAAVAHCQNEDEIWEVEADYLSASKRQRRRRFHKWGDISLADWLVVQASRRRGRAGRRVELRKLRVAGPRICPGCGKVLPALYF